MRARETVRLRGAARLLGVVIGPGAAVALGAALALTLPVRPASAQQRTTELTLAGAFAGNAVRRTAEVRMSDPLRPGFAAALRAAGRLVERPWGDVHLGGQLGATIWQTDTMAQAEGGLRTLGDVGAFARWRGATGAWAPTGGLAFGFAFGLPSFPELEAGVRPGYGVFGEAWAGVSLRHDRALVGLELGWAHHRVTAPLPRAVTTTNQLLLRLTVGIHPG